MNSSNTMEEVPRLETKRLVLRAMRPEDAEAIFGIYGNEEVMRYRDVLAFTRLEEAQQFLERMRSRCEQGNAQSVEPRQSNLSAPRTAQSGENRF